MAGRAQRMKVGAELAAWVRILALPIGSCVTAGKLPNFPEPLLPRHERRGNDELPDGAVTTGTQRAHWRRPAEQCLARDQ